MAEMLVSDRLWFVTVVMGSTDASIVNNIVIDTLWAISEVDLHENCWILILKALKCYIHKMQKRREKTKTWKAKGNQEFKHIKFKPSWKI